jgi:hypothetical protein
MVNQVEPKLLQPLVDFLQKERLVLLSTIDYETGAPNVSAISWVYAKNEQTILFSVDNRSRIVENIKYHSKIVLNLMANESTYSISGDAEIIQEKMEGVPLKLALIKLDIQEVRDVMFYGSKITVLPEYDKTYDLNAAKKLDNQVMETMKKA